MKDRRIVRVNLGERSYEIEIRAGLINDLAARLRRRLDNRRCLVITDDNVVELHGGTIKKNLDALGVEWSQTFFPAGEESKTLKTFETLCRECRASGLDRSSLLIAFGGGVPGDLAGFVAAVYMRGIDFIQIPTTLLAMVDSSVGGKTGVDLPEGKNLVGAFWQPRKVLIDPEFLETLPEREIRCGLGEVVKYAIILDPEFFNRLEDGTDRLNNLDLDFYSEVIAHCCWLKARVVTEDEKEGGQRAILNFGHTFAHAIETVSNYRDIAHGEAVSVGMCMACDLAIKLGLLNHDLAKRGERLLTALSLPRRISGYDPEAIHRAMASDKKAVGGQLRLVLPDAIGKVSIHENVDGNTVLEAIKGRCD